MEAHTKLWLDVAMNKHSFPYVFSVYSTLTWDIILRVDFMLNHKVALHVARAEAQIVEVTAETSLQKRN